MNFRIIEDERKARIKVVGVGALAAMQLIA